MLGGIVIKGVNAVFFKKKYDLIFESIPQFLFLSSTFGYMSICIIVKWLRSWTVRDPVSIISLFINFNEVLKGEELIGSHIFQQNLQKVFIIICFVCIFMMLLPKPIILYYE